jgi:inositol-phosphate phosphatase/L-galactose 1-phosphate phosphatase/histidinol-phosphatase
LNQDRHSIEQTVRDMLATAAKITLPHFRSPVAFDVKADDSPVTIADKAAEKALREILASRFPDHAIYGEEQGHSAGEGGTWVIDPIDGTKSFLLGNPLFGCLVAFVEDGQVQAGGLAMPALNEIWYADRSGPAQLNGNPCRVSACRELKQANILTTSPDFFNAEELKQFKRLCEHTRYLRYGGDCYTYAMLAGGWVDLVVESGLYAFDYLPLVPIVEQAGGVISDWQGNALGLDSGHQVIAAATPELHEAAIRVLDKAQA